MRRRYIFWIITATLFTACDNKSNEIHQVEIKPTIEIVELPDPVIFENTAKIIKIGTAYVVPDLTKDYSVKLSLSGSDAALFKIENNILSFRSAPDYEKPADANSDNIYSVVVTAHLKPSAVETQHQFNITVINTEDAVTSHEYVRDDSQETVIDNKTGLMWQDNLEVTTMQKQWLTDANFNAGNYFNTGGETAISYCEHLNLAGFDDWRLPRIHELNYIIEDKTIFPVFQHVTLKKYWSSTTHEANPKNAFCISFKTGSVVSQAKDNSLNKYMKSSGGYVRCVRDLK